MVHFNTLHFTEEILKRNFIQICFQNIHLCINDYSSRHLEESQFMLKNMYQIICERGSKMDPHRPPLPNPRSFLLWEKSAFLACVSWKFWYMILYLLDILRTYGKLLMKLVWQVRLQSQTFCLATVSVLTDLAVQLVFYLQQNQRSDARARPACVVTVRCVALTGMASVQDQRSPPPPQILSQSLTLVPPSLLNHMTWLSHRTLWENRGYVCAPFG